MSEDPEQVARAILSVRQALKNWQTAALEAAAAAREEHRATSAVVEQSGRAAMQARVGAEDLAAELARLGSALESARGGVMAAAAAVQERSRKHGELADHVRRTHEAWSGHLERARRDHAVAVEERAKAEQAASVTGARLQAAQVRLQRARRNAERAAALAELSQAQDWHRYCSTRRDQAVMWEQEQGARVERCTRALGLAQQANAEFQGAAAEVSSATRAVAAAQVQLASVEGAMQGAHAHLGRMTQSAEEAMSHAGRASQDLTSATPHLYEVEAAQQQGHLLAMDAGYEMEDILQQLRLIDAPMTGSGGAAGTEGELPAEEAGGDAAALRDLAAFRERSGMPVAGSSNDEDTAARLDVPGSDPLYGRNAHGREITMRVNRYTKYHAEGDVFQQALDKGLRAERAVMYVDRPLCDACGRYGGVGSLLRQTGIKAVEVVAPDGRFRITADQPSVPTRIGDAP